MRPTIAVLAILLAAPSFAELTPAEKTEARKLYVAQTYLSEMAKRSHSATVLVPAVRPVDSVDLNDSKNNTFRAAGRLLHTHLDGTNRYDIEYPATYGDPIPGRAAAILEAWGYLDAAIQHLNATTLPRLADQRAVCGPDSACVAHIDSAISYGQLALSKLQSVNRALAYENPLPRTFQQSFGPHGDYASSQASIMEARRNVGYTWAYLNNYAYRYDPSYRVEYAAFSGALNVAFDIFQRVLLLKARVAAASSDFAIVESDEGVAFTQIQVVAVSAAPKLSSAIINLTACVHPDSLIWVDGEREYESLRNAIASVSGGWVHGDAWFWELLRIHP